ncbi:hypothetical protein [Thermomonospora cellulosilytica]|uniref:Uncharacterized protein n=1 Tax=Thermomonospora cellulosilytica TaxID=1411118 RepID=A0A7W3MXK4_9ACTN|nr:hypothetical protein [Thermomonospora cellulosilytica]MBA9003755.1 hypothetical protein [Thermomonospora cellulosilytica]
MSIWDDPDIRVGGDFVKFNAPGDSVSGTIQAIRKHKFDDGSVAPQVLLVTDEGEEKTLTAGQIRLKTALATERPEAGDWIRITLTQIEKRAGGKDLKHFTVEIRRGQGAPAQPQPPAGQTMGAGPGWGAPAAPAAPAAMPQQYPPQAVPQAAPQQYAPAAPPAAPIPFNELPTPPAQPAPQAAPAAPGMAALTPEQQAAIAALTPEQRAAMGLPG